jgi:hypothetical protein
MGGPISRGERRRAVKELRRRGNERPTEKEIRENVDTERNFG